MEGDGAGINVYNFIHGKDAPLTKEHDKTGSTKIVQPKNAEKQQVVGQGNAPASRTTPLPDAVRSAGDDSGYQDAPSALRKVDNAEKKALGYAKGGPVPRKGYEGGGEVDGPGTGTSDSVPASLSNGEYVIPAHVVSYLGTKFFDDLVQKITSMNGGGQPNPFAELMDGEPAPMPATAPRRA